MRILIGTDTYYPHANGASYFTQRLARGMVDAGHEVLVICPSDSIKNHYTEHNGVKMFGIRSIPVMFYKDFRFAPPGFITKAIDEVVTDFKPDVVHIQSHFFVSRVVLDVAQAHGLPTVGTNHFMPDNFLPLFPVAKGTVRKLGWDAMKKVFVRFDVVTTPTESAAKLLKSVGFPKPVEAISCGIDLKRFTAGPKDHALQKRLKLRDDLPTFLFVGRVDKDKRIDVIIQGFAKARAKAPMQFAVAGRGPERETLAKLAESLGVADDVHLLGFVPDVDLPAFYRLGDAFIAASIAELQSIVTLEAMASGLPVIGANAVALPELAQPGKNGFLFEPNDTDQLAEHMITLANDPALRAKYGKASLQIVQAHDFPDTIRKYVAAYQRAIDMVNAAKPSATIAA